MKTPRSFFAALIAVSLLSATAFAADVSGKWKWTSLVKTGGPAEIVGAFVVKDGVLSGTVTGRQGPADISDTTYSGNLVSFTVTRSSGTSTVIFKYSGRLNGDTITGTVEKNPVGGAAPTKADWIASRVH